jgi:adenosylcobinamide-phosphate synthase
MVTIFREYPVNFWAIGALPLGMLLSLALEWLPWKPDPSRGIGWLIDRAEGGLRVVVAKRRGGPGAELVAGSVLAVVVIGFVGGLAWFAVEVFNQLGGPATLIGRALLIAGGLSLGRIGREVLRASEATDLATARRAAFAFGGIDSPRLDAPGIRLACVRSVGERANCLVIAPLFWLAIGGPAGLWCYQGVDALGRQFDDGGPRSRYFGFTSIRFDDLANFVPERLTWLLISLSAALLGEDGVGALRVGFGRGRQFPDRPGAWGMAALFGALGVRPGGRSDEPAIEPTKVRLAVRIMQVAGLHAAALAVVYRIVVLGD